MTTTLVTTTRDRALCFSLLERWVRSQSVKWDQWLVVNDGKEEYSYTMGQEVIRRDPSADGSMPSICANWLAAIQRVRGDNIIVLEDDDWYAPNYVEKMLEGLSLGELAGVTRDIYYRPFTREFLHCCNVTHASLAASAFRSCLLPFVRAVIEYHRTVWIDQHLWWKPPAERVMVLRQPYQGAYLHVGMKNMPGAGGLGCGHGDDFGAEWENDPEFAKLLELVGAEAAEVYRGLVQ